MKDELISESEEDYSNSEAFDEPPALPTRSYSLLTPICERNIQKIVHSDLKKIKSGNNLYQSSNEALLSNRPLPPLPVKTDEDIYSSDSECKISSASASDDEDSFEESNQVTNEHEDETESVCFQSKVDGIHKR